MRLALAFAAIVVASPVMAADEPPVPAQTAIDALVAGHFVQDHCSNYRGSLVAVQKLFDQAQMSSADLTVKYKDYFDRSAALAENQKAMSNANFCDTFFDFYQGFSDAPHVIEKR